MSEAIEVQSEIVGGQQQNPLAVTKVGMTAVGRALGLDELKANLDFIRDVMQNVMKEGKDYGKIPGTGDRPTLLQPGAQKLLMTFQLTEYVKKELLREYQGMHREYEFTIAIKAQNGKEWDGVGSCSTFEKKYRYRQGGRKCPRCGKATILSARKGPPGFFCWTKKGGCGEKFAIDDPTIVNQTEQGQVENHDIADQWNTVRKVAFKRALVHAAINATNTSELWTQDLEDKAPEDPGEESQPPPGPRRGSQTPPRRPATQPRPSAAPAPAPKTVPYADENTRGKMLRQFEDHKVLTEFFVKIGWLLPNSETVEDLALRYVPITKRQADTLSNCFKNFKDGGDAVAPYPPNPSKPVLTGNDAAGPEKPRLATTLVPVPGTHPADYQKPRDPEWWRDIICPIPPRGVPRDKYLRDPDTVGSMYDDRHNEETARRLFGFIAHFEVKKSWTGNDGKERPNSAAQIATDTLFREALDACADYHDKHEGDKAPELQHGREAQSAAAYEPAQPEEDDVPF